MASNRRLGVLVVGGANFDYEIRAPSLPGPGETVVGETLIEAPGGKGANQAVAAARLGAATAFVGRVGDDERGQRILAQLATERIEISRAVKDPDAPTGVALIVVDGRGEKMIVTAPGANRRLGLADIERAAPLFASTKVVLLQLEAGVATALAAARRGRASRAIVVLDAAPPAPLPDELLAAVDVVRCNASEARIISGIEVTGVDSAREAAFALRRRGAGAACIGVPGGDLLVFEVDELWLPHQRVEVVDATGAGDAFSAGLAVGLAEGRSLSDAAWLGCAAAALKTTQLGAQPGLPRRADVDRLLATIARD
jgi:ribokinase